MRILVALNNDGNSKESTEIYYDASGKETFDNNPRILNAYEISRVEGPLFDSEEKPKVYMYVVGEKEYVLTVIVDNQKAGEDFLRKLVADAYIDLTCSDVSTLYFDQPVYL